jgi:hypothetical protein
MVGLLALPKAFVESPPPVPGHVANHVAKYHDRRKSRQNAYFTAAKKPLGHAATYFWPTSFGREMGNGLPTADAGRLAAPPLRS